MLLFFSYGYVKTFLRGTHLVASCLKRKYSMFFVQKKSIVCWFLGVCLCFSGSLFAGEKEVFFLEREERDHKLFLEKEEMAVGVGALALHSGFYRVAPLSKVLGSFLKRHRVLALGGVVGAFYLSKKIGFSSSPLFSIQGEPSKLSSDPDFLEEPTEYSPPPRKQLWPVSAEQEDSLDLDGAEALGAHYSSVSQFIGKLLEFHQFKDQRDLYHELAGPVFSSMVHLLDPEKLLFTAEDLDLLRTKYGLRWLEDVVTLGKYHIFKDILKLKSRRAREALKYLNSLEDPSSGGFSYELKRPEGLEDYANNKEQLRERWLRHHELLGILYHFHSTQENSATIPSDFSLEAIYAQRFLSWATSERAPESIRQGHDHIAWALRQGLFMVFSKYSVFAEKHGGGTLVGPGVVRYGALGVSFDLTQPWMQVHSVDDRLRAKGVLLFPGDTVLGVQLHHGALNQRWFQPLIFMYSKKDPFTSVLDDFVEAEQTRVSLQDPENFIIFTLLRSTEEGYELVEVPVLRSSDIYDSLPSEKIQSGEVLMEKDLFSSSLHTLPGSFSKVAVLKIPSFGHFLSKESTSMSPLSREIYAHTRIVEFYNHVKSLMERSDVGSMIIDLRDNGGGDALLAYYLMHAFRGPGHEAIPALRRKSYEFSGLLEKVVRSRDNLNSLYLSQIRLLVTSHSPIPVVVLVGNRTASAAELFASELRAHGRALVVGSATSGKGSGSSVFHMEGENMTPCHVGDENAVYLTHGKFFVSDGSCPHGVGVGLDLTLHSSPWDLIPSQNPAFLSKKLFPEQLSLEPLEVTPEDLALRDPSLIARLKQSAAQRVEQSEYFRALELWAKQRKKQHLRGTVSLDGEDYQMRSFDPDQGKSPAPRPPLAADFPGDVWILTEDPVLDQALWIAGEYAEFLQELIRE